MNSKKIIDNLLTAALQCTQNPPARVRDKMRAREATEQMLRSMRTKRMEKYAVSSQALSVILKSLQHDSDVFPLIFPGKSVQVGQQPHKRRRILPGRSLPS